MKYSIPLLGLFLITIPFASCTSEREKTAQIVTDNYVHFVDSIVNNRSTIVSEIDGFLAMEVAHQILDKINNTKKMA